MEQRVLLRASRRINQHRRYFSAARPCAKQAHPVGDYYASILGTSAPKIASVPPTSSNPSSTPPIEPVSSDKPPEASILFSSRLSSPLERGTEIRKKSVLVAGVLVPPKPDEPDNCCMSGCVNCVWDRYGEDLEEWAAAAKKADIALKKAKGSKRRQPVRGTGLMLGDREDGAQHTAISMDDDGGGSETNWGTGLDTNFTSEDLFKGVPVGIREFMKQEKRLKEKHAKEEASG